MTPTMICHPRCSTCAKARAWLEEKGIAYQWRDIQQQNPTAAELRRWQAQSGLPLGRFFNTSGMAYRELGVAQKRKTMGEEEQFALLASDGMLVKRPLLVGEGFVLVGFKPGEWEERLLAEPKA